MFFCLFVCFFLGGGGFPEIVLKQKWRPAGRWRRRSADAVVVVVAAAVAVVAVVVLVAAAAVEPIFARRPVDGIARHREETAPKLHYA